MTPFGDPLPRMTHGYSVVTIHQCCPVCGGCGTVPPGFYTQSTMLTSTAREQCKRCSGSGTITSTRQDYWPVPA